MSPRHLVRKGPIRWHPSVYPLVFSKVISSKISTFLIEKIKGENGSGKTSLLRTVAGLIEPNDGLIQWNHENINNNRQNYHKNISWLSHKHGFKGHLSIKENLQFFC